MINELEKRIEELRQKRAKYQALKKKEKDLFLQGVYCGASIVLLDEIKSLKALIETLKEYKDKI